MTRWGVGPKFALLSSLYGVFTLVISRCYYPFFKINFISDQILIYIGFVFIFIVFGNSFIEYKKRVPAVLPVGLNLFKRYNGL